MEFTFNRIDVPLYEGGDGPHDIIPRKAGETWMVPHEPIDVTGRIDWRFHQRETHVYVPLFPYLLPTEPDLAMGHMLQLGTYAAGDLGKRILRVHLALGHPVNEVAQEGSGVAWQFQVGIALRIK
jgi:hypothetical protein